MTGINQAIDNAIAHLEDLRDAWERGCISEHDGKGLTRSNRNHAVLIELQKYAAREDAGRAK